MISKKMFIVVIGLILTFVMLSADVPNLIDYQGRLADNNGDTIEGNTSITFSIYNVETGGTALWSETQASVDVNDGLFQVTLGSNASFPENLFDDAERWIGINVAGDGEMTPRTKIVSVPYAKTDGDWTIDGNDMYSDVSGNVGIGTTNPDYKLDVFGNYGWHAPHNFKMRGDGEFSFDFQDGDGNDYWQIWDSVHNSILAVRNNGKVGIGLTNPSVELEVNGEIKTNFLQIPTNAQDGYLLTSNEDGDATWESLPDNSVTPDKMVTVGVKYIIAHEGLYPTPEREAMIGEIRIFAGTFIPSGWLECNGQLYSTSEYALLFSILGTQYGGNGTTTFGVPDLSNAVPINE